MYVFNAALSFWLLWIWASNNLEYSTSSYDVFPNEEDQLCLVLYDCQLYLVFAFDFICLLLELVFFVLVTLIALNHYEYEEMQSCSFSRKKVQLCLVYATFILFFPSLFCVDLNVDLGFLLLWLLSLNGWEYEEMNLCCFFSKGIIFVCVCVFTTLIWILPSILHVWFNADLDGFKHFKMRIGKNMLFSTKISERTYKMLCDWVFFVFLLLWICNCV